MIPFGYWSVTESPYATVGHPVVLREFRRLLAHPLDVIAWSSLDYDDRMVAAMQWLRADREARFDALLLRITTTPEETR